MSTSKQAASECARQFIDDVLKINAEHGMRSVKSEGAYDTAIANATRSYEQISRHVSPVAQQSR
jgi:hypothetical protein